MTDEFTYVFQIELFSKCLAEGSPSLDPRPLQSITADQLYNLSGRVGITRPATWTNVLVFPHTQVPLAVVSKFVLIPDVAEKKDYCYFYCYCCVQILPPPPPVILLLLFLLLLYLLAHSTSRPLCRRLVVGSCV